MQPRSFWRRLTGWRRLAALGIPVGVVLAAIWAFTDHTGAPGTAASRTVPAGNSSVAHKVRADFAYLSRQTSNRCDLEPAELLSYRNSRHLQGSCCSHMDAAHYHAQLRGLRRYARVPTIPPNPYDIPAPLARRLLQYQHRIRLSAGEQATYRRAMSMTDEKGPCCCHCWRWDAFQGLSNYLIAKRGWSAVQVAAVIDLEDGCGGPADAPQPMHS